ncbi:uncharacterized protein PG986_006649 [Apiospora aurea]|uniref:DUF4440 domain-containing protein n=1 Tax=Apiospora aurea TaxID=335848 RepID=A0ABR1QAB1_9PEZI
MNWVASHALLQTNLELRSSPLLLSQVVETAHHGNQEEGQVLATVTAFLDSLSDKPPPLTETHKHVLPSAYAVDWRAHAGELIQTPRNAYVAEMERRLERMREAGLRSFVQSLADPAASADTGLPPPRVWVDAGQGIAAVWAGFGMRSNGEEKYRGVGAFTLYSTSSSEQTEEEGKRGGGRWKIAAFADSRWDPEYFRPRPTPDAQATEELLATARAFTALLNSGKGDTDAAVLPGCITHRLDKNGLYSEPFQGLLLADETTGQQQRRNIEVLDGEGRAVGGVGFLWMHYAVGTAQEDGQMRTRSTATLTFLQRNGKWLVSGVQEAERLAS